MPRLLMAVALAATVTAALAAQEAVAPPTNRPAAATASDDRADHAHPFRRLFETLARDIRKLPSRDNRTFLLNGALLAAAVYPIDDITTLGASSSHILKASFSGWGKALGREWVQGGGALAAYTAGRLFDRPVLASVGGDLIEAQLLGVTVTQGMKFAVGRTRPDGEARSFPSGHASAAFATASVLERHFGRRLGLPAYAIAVYTSASRLQANSHYASDVIVGAVIGIAAGRTATIEIAEQRLRVGAAPLPGGAGIFVHIGQY